jgi:AcrR family transcriptional regulator
VDARILDAARRLFLERGLDGTSMDDACLARAGKRTIYARFPSKETLFIAVVLRALPIEHFESDAPTGASVEERLESLGVSILKWVLVSETIGMMRLAIAEARRFPDLASRVNRLGRERAEEAVVRLLGEAAQSDELGKLPAFAPERLTTTTHFFRGLVVLPLLIRALYAEKLNGLHAEIRPHVARSVAFFLAACRLDGVT